MYRRIRNSIFKFILSNLSDFDYEKNKSREFDLADVFVLNELKQNIIKIIDAYENYNFATVIKTVNLEAIKLSS
jgi:isoleucyl-tRNA synthetase